MSAMKPSLSIVTTLYNSTPYIEEFYERITKAARKITNNYNIIMVNDGSPDDSLNLALHLQEKDEKLEIIDLSRNFGHHKAIMNGLEYAQGEHIFLIDVDLEEEPELLSLFWDELKKENNTDVICGICKTRKGNLFEKISGTLFYKFINSLSSISLQKNAALARLMTRRYVNNLLLHTEKELVFSGIAALTGYNQKYIEINKIHKGTTTYTLSRKISMAFNYITSLSALPLIYIFYVGILISTLSFCLLLWVTFKSLFFNISPGWTSVVASIWTVGGMIIFFLGVIGIYLAKIFTEVKSRPNVVVKDIYTNNSSSIFNRDLK